MSRTKIVASLGAATAVTLTVDDFWIKAGHLCLTSGSHGFPDATFDYLFGKNLRMGKPIITQTNVSDHLPVTCDVTIQ